MSMFIFNIGIFGFNMRFQYVPNLENFETSKIQIWKFPGIFVKFTGNVPGNSRWQCQQDPVNPADTPALAKKLAQHCWANFLAFTNCWANCWQLLTIADHCWPLLTYCWPSASMMCGHIWSVWGTIDSEVSSWDLGVMVWVLWELRTPPKQQRLNDKSCTKHQAKPVVVYSMDYQTYSSSP